MKFKLRRSGKFYWYEKCNHWDSFSKINNSGTCDVYDCKALLIATFCQIFFLWWILEITAEVKKEGFADNKMKIYHEPTKGDGKYS